MTTAPASAPSMPGPLALLRDVRVLAVIGQIVFVLAVLIVIGVLVSNAYSGLAKAGLVPSFSFLNLESSFQIDEGLVSSPHTSSDTFLHAFGVGLVNTLRTVIVGLIGATLLGLFLGIGRLSNNWLLRNLSRSYIEIFQNTPLLVQLIFIYSGLFLRLPDLADITANAPADVRALTGPFWISNKGFAMPALWPTGGVTAWTIAVALGGAAAAVIYLQRRKRRIETGQQTYALQVAALVLIGTLALATLIFGPYTISLPTVIRRSARIVRFDSTLGVIVSPEYVALTLGLILYTAAFIAEVVRAGIQSVPNGQWEAARALGLNGGQTLRLIVLPQALRVMFPPLTNLYSALLKNSALGAYIGFSDLFGVGRTIQLQSGQSIPVTLIVMAIYLFLTLIISYGMNLLNARFQFRTR